MIGFIAGVGVIVRNSIILVDFVELKLREGMAPAVVVGSFVMLFDPSSRGSPSA